MQASIDHSKLDELRALQRPGQTDFVAHMIEIFFESTKGQLEQIKGAVAVSDLQVLSEVSHSLKSSAANLGAVKMSELCLKLERMGHDGIMKNEILLIFEQLRKEYAAVCLELADIMHDATKNVP